MKIEELYSATISFDTNNVLLVKFKDEVEVGLEEMIKLVDVSLQLVAGTPFYLLVDARNILGNMDHDARDYITSHQEYSDLNIAQAIIVNNMPIKILANFYTKFYPQANPVRVFGELEKGRAWLVQQ